MVDAARASVVLISRSARLLQGLLVLAELDPVSAGTEAPGALRRLLREIEQVERQLAAARLRVMRVADSNETAADEGFANTGAWVSAATRASRREAAAQADVAARLRAAVCHESGLAQESLTQQALDSGEISLAHARVIVLALADLPDGLDRSQVGMVEAHLIEQARTVDPVRLRRLARRALEAFEPAPDVVDADEDAKVEAEEDRAHRAASFWMRDNGDGTMSGGFCIPRRAGEALKTILDAMTAPRSRTASGSVPAGGPAEAHGTGSSEGCACGVESEARAQEPTGRAGSWKLAQLDWQHRRGCAFADLLALLPTRHLPNRAAATIIVHTDLETLRGQVNRVARTSYSEDISAAALRRLACQADLVPVVLDTRSAPLDLGRAARLFSSFQRLALSVLYETCAAAGCDRPFAWCELHHLDPWQTGGRTDLGNAVPLCGYHHRAMHRTDTSHTVTRKPSGACSIAFTRVRS